MNHRRAILTPPENNEFQPLRQTALDPVASSDASPRSIPRPQLTNCPQSDPYPGLFQKNLLPK